MAFPGAPVTVFEATVPGTSPIVATLTADVPLNEGLIVIVGGVTPSPMDNFDSITDSRGGLWEVFGPSDFSPNTLLALRDLPGYGKALFAGDQITMTFSGENFEGAIVQALAIPNANNWNFANISPQLEGVTTVDPGTAVAGGFAAGAPAYDALFLNVIGTTGTISEAPGAPWSQSTSITNAGYVQTVSTADGENSAGITLSATLQESATWVAWTGSFYYSGGSTSPRRPGGVKFV